MSARQPFLLVVQSRSSHGGRVAGQLMEMGHPLDVRCPQLGHPLPPDLDGHAGAVIFGGPMSANDEHLPGIRAQLDWLPRTALRADKPVLGICLGAQLIARTLGAKVAPHPEGVVEIGYTEVRATPEGAGLFPPAMRFYQWHAEGFALPAGARLLATGDVFPNQACAYDGRVYAVQPHPEVRRETVAHWTMVAAADLAKSGAQSAAEQLAAAERHDPEMDAWTRGFLAAVTAP